MCGNAASPCPPPPPPVFDPPDCPVPAPVSSATFSSAGCFGGNCAAWGPAKAIDGRTRSTSSLAIVARSANPYMQFDLGRLRTDISVVRVVGRSDAYADPYTSSMSQQSDLSVWLSPTPAFSSGTLCASNLSPSAIGEVLNVLCPVNASAQYVTVWMNTTGKSTGMYAGIDFLTLAEVTPLYDGERGTVCRGSNGCMGFTRGPP